MDNKILIPDELDTGFSYDESEDDSCCDGTCHSDNMITSFRDMFKYSDIDRFHERVTSLLNVGPTGIKSDEIDYPENAPAAERRMKSLVPNWAELDEEKFAMFESCIVYMTCWILCPIANNRRVSKQTTPSLSLQYVSGITDERSCDRFNDLINDLLEEINDEEPGESSFYGFRVTKSSDCRRRTVWQNRLPH